MFPKMFLESLKQLPKGPKKQQFDFFWRKKNYFGRQEVNTVSIDKVLFFPSQDVKKCLEFLFRWLIWRTLEDLSSIILLRNGWQGKNELFDEIKIIFSNYLWARSFVEKLKNSSQKRNKIHEVTTFLSRDNFFLYPQSLIRFAFQTLLLIIATCYKVLSITS